MKHFRFLLTIIAVLLCSNTQVHAEVIFYDDWTSDNQGVDNGTSTKTYTFEVPVEGILSFDWLVSSEPTYDKLTIVLDNVLVYDVSGEQSGTYSNEISSGVHSLVATYTKDGSGNQGNDLAKLSNVKVEIPNFAELDGISYISTSNNTVTVLGVTDTTVVNIPDTIVIDDIKYLVNEIAATAFSACPNVTMVTIPNSVTEIKANTFENCKKLTTVVLPGTLISIGNAAFKGCGSLREITIPNSVTAVGAYAFESCGTLGSATLSTALTSIGEGAFKNCISLASISAIPNTVTSISHSTFEGCAALTAISLPNALNSIGESAFKGCANLAAVTIPSTVTSIGGSAFQGCASLATIALPNGVTSIGSRTFSECTNLTSIDIPQTMTSIGEYAFYNCEKMQTITIPKSVSWMGFHAFEGCGGEHYLNCNTHNDWGDGPYWNSKITKVTIGEGVQVIGRNAFHYSQFLSEVVLPSTVTTVEPYAFSGTNLSTIELPAGILSIYDNALPSSMSKMTCNAITPPTLLTEAGGMASLGNISVIYVPQGCGQAYRDVYPWSSKVIFDGNGITAEVTVTPGMLGETILNDSDVNYLSDVNNLIILGGSINETDIANIKNSMPNLVSIDMAELDMKNIPSGMFFDRKALLSIILPNNVETIGENAFYNCINLENIVLPEGLKTIEDGHDGRGCFAQCRSLKSILFPSTLKSVGAYAFSECSRLQKVEFKEGTTDIRGWVFAHCSSLNDLILPNSLRNIGEAAFRNCSSLRSLIIPEGVNSIGYNSSDDYGAFAYCSSLKQITLPKELQVISNGTFYNCSSLTTIDIPEGITYIGRNAFSGCSNITSVSLPSTLAACSSTPFAGCNKLNEVSCLALIPPTLADGLLTLEDMGLPLKRILKVPEWTINRYKLTSGWAAFTKMDPIVGFYPSTISVVGDAILTMPTAGLPANYKPDMVISANGGYTMEGRYNYTASLHLRGSGALKLNNFSMISNGMAGMAGTQFLNEVQVEADNVSITTYLNSYNNGDYYGSSNSGWYFLSFPFDIKLSDVITSCDWVVRQYDGKARANNKLENTWVTVPQNGTLNAGQGYIWACTGGSFTLSAVNNANKNLIFATTQRDIPLQEYAAELVSNSSWNLVGNPFPCYYNTNEMDYTAPITVWENNTYAAYSPVDDNYVLRPFEAFFVQCPAGVKSIGFKPEGRQLTGGSVTPSTPATAPSRMQAKAERQVINLVLSNANSADRTRIVINDNAKMDYELTCDAAKFMSDDAHMPQIYSVSNEEMFAINERPMGNGVVKLGTHFGVAGTYTIAMQSASNMVVVLVDHKTGIETDLTAGDYTFSAEAGDSDRFEVRMYADEETTAIDAVAADTKVVAVSNTIVVTTSADANVELYNAAGSLIAVGQGKSMTFDAAQGMYIVKVNGVSHKVAVVK